MAESDKIPQIDPAEVEILIQKIEQNKLDERERRLIAALLRTFLYIVAQLQEKKITLLKIKDMIFGPRSEKNKKEKDRKGGNQPSEGGSGDSCKSPYRLPNFVISFTEFTHISALLFRDRSPK